MLVAVSRAVVRDDARSRLVTLQPLTHCAQRDREAVLSRVMDDDGRVSSVRQDEGVANRPRTELFGEGI